MDGWIIAVNLINLDRLIIALIHNQRHVSDILRQRVPLFKQSKHHRSALQVARADQNIDIILLIESGLNCIIFFTSIIQIEHFLFLLEDSPVGFGHSEETVISHAGGSTTVEKLVEGALLEYVECYFSILIWLMRECIDLVIIDFSVPHA